MESRVSIHNERIDDIPMLFFHQRVMGIPQIIDEQIEVHGNHKGLSLGWLVTGWLTYILSESDHRLSYVEPWAQEREQTLQALFPEPMEAKDFSDDRLGDVLDYLSQDESWQEIEKTLGRHLRQNLAQRLPDYMLPSAFVFLDSLPLTPNGKLDRQALPAPEYTGSTASHVPAQSLDETRLVLVWQETLGVHPVGVTDNFFELGGHSLLAAQIVQRMRRSLQRDIALQQLFKTPTIRGLLQSLDDARSTTSSFVPLRTGNGRADQHQDAEERPPLFLFPPGDGVVFPYTTLLPYIPGAQPVYAQQSRGIYDDLPPFESLEALAAGSIEEMKTIQPAGPYTVGGWSFGGMVAFEVARQLTQQGDTVAFLGVMDAYPQASGHTTAPDDLTPLDELQGFFYLLGDILGGDYRSLGDELFAEALAQEEAVTWLLERMQEQGVQLVMDPAIIQRIWQTLKHNSQLMRTYQPQPYAGPISLFWAEESAPADGVARWQALALQPLDAVQVRGEHLTMLNAEHVDILGRALAARL